MNMNTNMNTNTNMIIPQIPRMRMITISAMMMVILGTILFLSHRTVETSGKKSYGTGQSGDGTITIVPRICSPRESYGNYTSLLQSHPGGLIGRLPYGQREFVQTIALNADGSMLFVGVQSSPGRVDAYGWDCNGREWYPLPSLYATSTDLSDFFGFSVAISDDGWTVAVVAPGTYVSPGKVQIFSLSVNDSDSVTDTGTDTSYAWTLNGTMMGFAYSHNMIANFGQSVSMSADGSVMAASGRNLTFAKMDDSVPIPYFVRVYKYKYAVDVNCVNGVNMNAGGGWVQWGQEIVTPTTVEWDVNLVVEVSGDGNSLLLSSGRLDVPLVYHYQTSTNIWVQDEMFRWDVHGFWKDIISVSMNYDCSRVVLGGNVQIPNRTDTFSVRKVARVFEVQKGDGVEGESKSSSPSLSTLSQIGPDILPVEGDSCFACAISLDHDGTRFVTAATSFYQPLSEEYYSALIIQGVVRTFEEQQLVGGKVDSNGWEDISVYDETKYTNRSSTEWGPSYGVAISGDGGLVASTRREFVDIYMLPSQK